MNQLRLSTLTAISSTISSPNLFLYLAVPPLLPYLVVSFLVSHRRLAWMGHFFSLLRFIVLVVSNVCAIHNFSYLSSGVITHLARTVGMGSDALGSEFRVPLSPIIP